MYNYNDLEIQELKDALKVAAEEFYNIRKPEKISKEEWIQNKIKSWKKSKESNNVKVLSKKELKNVITDELMNVVYNK